ncbi:transmembrane protease serine 9-like isoform X2 [Oculina patagonica]
MILLVLLLLGGTATGQLPCGHTPIAQSRVIGGQDAKPGAWPWQIALQRNGRFICGGSLIGPDWVVTAAHCVASSSNPAYYKVVVGDHNRNTNEGTEEIVDAKRIISHPQYNKPSPINNDIALIQLVKSVKLSQRVNTVCLPSHDSDVPTGSKCYITGWGKIKHPGSSHPILQQAMMPPIDQVKCRQKLQASGVSISLTPQMLCAGVDNTILSGCHGDSGGPYVCLNADMKSYTLHGAVSWGSSRCDSKHLYSVFARVTQYRGWIKQQTGIGGGGGSPPPPVPTNSSCGGSPTPPSTPPAPTTAVGSECSNYQVLNDNDRAKGFKAVNNFKCDQPLARRWYKFEGGAGIRMPDQCVPTFHCGTHAPGWLSGAHPTVAEGAVQRKVCFHWSNNCCKWSKYIQVRNCGGFFVYELSDTPTCSLRYCGDKDQGGSPPPPVTASPATPPPPTSPAECSNYQVLNDNDRAKGFKAVNSFKCDRPLARRWYKFEGGAGIQMPDQCVPTFHCGTHAPGWLSGAHPTVAEGAVQRKVCFHWSNNCCKWSKYIQVRNCGGFYVYELSDTPTCSLRYCGDKDQGSTPPPVTTLPPAPIATSSGSNGCGSSSPATPPPPTTPVSALECSNYKSLNENDRSKDYKGVIKCDRASFVKQWYRFEGGAGTHMPDKCVPTYYCGTHAPGWLSGAHPTVAEGAVQRKVCFHWTSNCCKWSTDIRVRNCGAYYVYELPPTQYCNLRYCGDKNQVTPPPPTSSPTGSPLPPECSSHKVLNENDREKGFKAVNNYKCDRPFTDQWYKFEGSAGTKMPDKCVPKYHCGTHAPGWLDGAHPTVAEGAVQRKVCFHWSSGCCQWSRDIQVRNCGGFYVYKLPETPGCSMRYCGDKDQGQVTPPPPTVPGSPPPPGSCGIRPHSRIVGGVNAKHGDWPWQVQLRTTSGFPYCGGSLVSPQWVVTATHCVQNKSPSSIVIRLGAHRRVNTVGSEQDIRVSKVITHPSYHKPTRYSHDIALLKLEKPAQRNRFVNLVCLPHAVAEPSDGTKCWITGWGRLASGGATPEYLQQVQVPVVSRARCDKAYPGKIHDSMVCAGLDQGGIDSCQGDSGGPMVCETGGKFYLHGATSWGYGCASPGKFGVYAKVKNLLPWLNSEMSKN